MYSLLNASIQPWHSTRIVSRINERTLVSGSGKIYRLFGEIDIEGMLLNGKKVADHGFDCF
jgi:SANTA (SANT Associated)